MPRVASPTLVGLLALAALASCSGNDLPTAPATNSSTPSVNIPAPSAALQATPTDDNILLATTDAPDNIDYQSEATVKMSLASQIGGTGGLDVMTLMDASGSVGTAGWTQEKDFVSSLIGTNFPNPPDGRTRMGIIEFSGSVRNIWQFTDDQTPSTMINVVDNLNWLASYTWTKSAVVDAINQFASLGDPTHGRLMLLITDGVPDPLGGTNNQNPCTVGSTIPNYLAAYGIHTVIVGVGTQWDPSVLSCLVQDPTTDIIQVSDFGALGSVLGQISTYVNPGIDNVKLTGTVSPDFDVTSEPTKSETVLTNGVDSSTPTYDSGTRTLTWTLNPVDRRVRNITLGLTPSADASPRCGSGRSAISGLQVTYTDPEGNTQSKALPDIVMNVTGCPVPPVVTPVVTGTPGDNGWYVSDVTIHWDVQSVAPLTNETNCDDVTINTDIHETTYTCSATSAGGTTTKSVAIKRDATPPSVTYTGNAGTYGVSQDVSIQCHADDGFSLVASSTCADVSDPAWQLGLGTHTYGASATDNAGNVGSGSTSFTVNVTTADLIALVNAWVSGHGAAGVKNSLIAKLEGKHPSVSAFVNELQALSGKKIPADKAALLISFAQAM